MASRLVTLVGIGSAATLLGACIIVGPGGSKRHDDGTGGGYLTTSSTTTTTTATGGAGGDTGSGGTGQGGSGGSCVPAAGTGETEAVCDTMNITPVNHGGAAFMCGPSFDQDPLGHASCHRAFDIYRAGQAEDFAACLALIGVESTCDEALVGDCVSEVYADACADPFIDETCQGIADVCGADPFDVAECSWALKVFSVSGVNQIIDCVNGTDPAVACQPAFDACFDTVTAVGG
ncbi:MAG: hypothetical protein IT373_26495 [Polyangiaceae bacterium]|nr:hypothetical protein [Polyangiaceae bacterium]